MDSAKVNTNIGITLVNRFKIALNKKLDGPLEDMSKEELMARLKALEAQHFTMAFDDHYITGKGPKSRVFNITGPNGFKISIPLRRLLICKAINELDEGLFIKMDSKYCHALLDDVDNAKNSQQ